MFDVGFAELVLILVIALLVLGPERLPGAIRTSGLWIAKLRRSFNDIRSEIEREVRFDEIKRDLHNQTILDSLKETGEEIGKLRDLPYDVSGIGKPRGPVAPADAALVSPSAEPTSSDSPPADGAESAPSQTPASAAQEAEPLNPPQLREPRP